MSDEVLGANILDGIEDQVIQNFAKVSGCQPGQIVRETRIDSISVDSLDLVDITFDIENFYDIDIPDDRIFDSETVGDFIDMVKERVAMGNA